MNVAEFLKALSEYPLSGSEDIVMELPSLCGISDEGRKSSKYPNCKNHGHLSLSVDPQTFYDVVAKGSHIVVLLTVPKTVIGNITKKG